MSYLVQTIQSIAAIFMGFLATCFSVVMLVSTLDFKKKDILIKERWWEGELIFFVISLFFLIVGFGFIWYGTSFFAPSLAPKTFMGTDFIPGLNLLFRGCMGVVFALVAIEILFTFDEGCLFKILLFLVFGGVSVWLTWVPWVGLSDELHGTTNLDPLHVKLIQLFQLVEPYIGFVIGMVLLLVMKDGIEALFSKELDFISGLTVCSYVGAALLLIVASVFLFCTRVLHLETLVNTTDILTNVMAQYKDWKSSAITIFEWGFAILTGISILIKKIMGAKGKTISITIPARIILVVVSIVLAILYVAEMI